MVKNVRHERNFQSLVLDASGKEQIPAKPKTVMPGQRLGPEQPGGKSGDSPSGGRGGGGGAVDGGGGGKGDKGGKKGGRGGKRGGGGADSEAESMHSSIPPDQRCCIRSLWGKCPMKPEECTYGNHLTIPTEFVKRHQMYQDWVKKYGDPPGMAAASAGGQVNPEKK